VNQRPYLTQEPYTTTHRFGATAQAETSIDESAIWTAPTSAWRVVVVENNLDDSEQLVHGLRRLGHKVQRVETGRSAVQFCGDADLILLGLDLPDIDGLEVCRGIRMKWDVPIISLTSRNSEVDRILGFQAGADDYIVKPYGFRELMARIDAVMRRASPRTTSPRVISHGFLQIDARLRTVSLHCRKVDVTRKEFDLLYLLASDPEAVVPRKRLMEQVWGGTWSSRTLDTHVSSLRRKLGASGWIVTVRGVGYQLGYA